MQSTNQAKKCIFAVGITLLYLGEVGSPEILDTSVDKTSGKERWLPFPRRHDTNINFECGRANLFLFGGKKNEC